MKLFAHSRVLVVWLLLLALLAGSSCARHGSLQRKTRWYKHHKGGTPCPCDKH